MVYNMRRTLIQAALQSLQRTCLGRTLESATVILSTFSIVAHLYTCRRRLRQFKLFRTNLSKSNDFLQVLEDVEDADLDIFHYYASRVKVLFLQDQTHSISRFVYMRIRQKHPGPLLKGLKKLHIASSDPDILLDAFLALGPNIDVVELHNDGVASSEFLRMFLSSLKDAVPKLSHIVMHGQSRVNLQPIQYFKNLRRLDIRMSDNYLPPFFLDKLGDLECLHDLTLHIADTSDTSILPSVLNIRRFNHLRSLHIIGHIWLVVRLLQCMDPRTLEYFVLDGTGDAQLSVGPQWDLCFRILSLSKNIKGIDIRHYPPARRDRWRGLTVLSISPLFHLQSLERLVLREVSLSFSDDDILTIVRAFQSLNTLVLLSSSRGPLPSIAALLRLSRDSPKLEELELCISGDIQDMKVTMKRDIDQIPRGHNHPLRILRINSPLEIHPRDVAEFARFLCRLFPNLEMLEGIGPQDQQESWSNIQIVYDVLRTELNFLKNTLVLRNTGIPSGSPHKGVLSTIRG